MWAPQPVSRLHFFATFARLAFRCRWQVEADAAFEPKSGVQNHALALFNCRTLNQPLNFYLTQFPQLKGGTREPHRSCVDSIPTPWMRVALPESPTHSASTRGPWLLSPCSRSGNCGREEMTFWSSRRTSASPLKFKALGLRSLKAPPTNQNSSSGTSRFSINALLMTTTMMLLPCSPPPSQIHILIVCYFL